jgi:universal stress protein A
VQEPPLETEARRLVMDQSSRSTEEAKRSDMHDIQRILVVSRMTEHCRKAVHYGISLARKYGAELHVLYVIHNPFGMEGFSLAIPSLRNLDAEWEKLQHEARVELDRIIDLERSDGMSIEVLVREGHPDKEILDVVKEMKIDLLIMIAHEKRRLEHLLFGRSGEELIRKMPCSVLLVKQEAGPIAY